MGKELLYLRVDNKFKILKPMNLILKISDDYKLKFTCISLLFGFILSMCSGDGGIFAIFFFLFSGLLLALGIALWEIKNFKKAFIDSLKISFGISAFIYILGYVYISLVPLL